MARYYFHIKDGADLIKDPEGTELSTPDDARLQALRSARELWAERNQVGQGVGRRRGGHRRRARPDPHVRADE